MTSVHLQDSHDGDAPTSLPGPGLTRPGAVAGEGAWANVAAHYGDPLREQRRLEDGLAAVDLSARGVVTVSGPDRLSWLHSMTTQQVSDLPPFTSTESFVLSPHGHIEYVLHVVDDGTRTWLITDPGKAPGLVAWLERMKFMLRVEVADVSHQYAVIGESVGAESTPQELAERSVIAWVDPWPNVGPVSAVYTRSDLHHPALGRRWRELIVRREAFDAEFGDRDPAGHWAYDALRIAAWRPDGLAEVDHRTIPHELDWLRTGVHLQKGCYRGQETVARVHNLGRPPRRLVFLHLDGSGHTLPAVGADITVPGAPRAGGRLTSVARHYVDGPIGLAVVKRSTPLDATLEIGGITALQTEVASQS